MSEVWVLHTRDEYEADEYRDDHFTSKDGAQAAADTVAVNAGFESGKVIDATFGEWEPDDRRVATISVVYPGRKPEQRTYYQSIDCRRVFIGEEDWSAK